jgi:hypothetical protein
MYYICTIYTYNLNLTADFGNINAKHKTGCLEQREVTLITFLLITSLK